MTRADNRKRISTDILVALAISVIINISYFIYFFGPSHLPMGRGPAAVSATNMNYANLIIQVVFYFVQAFTLIKIASAKRGADVKFWKRLILCMVVSIAFYFLTPYFNRDGDLNIVILGRRLMNPMTILKTSFTFIVSVLYVKIIELVYQRHTMTVENQLLKTENLQSRYNTLANQINPHFFFNSLNSLSMLVRESRNDDALEYIDRLSDTFRYIIQCGEKGMVTLEEELGFLDSYKYLFEIRYASKLFFNVSVSDKNKGLYLPSLSLQPIIENVVKHNTITSANPMEITIADDGATLVVSNPVHPKIEPETSTRTGLKNLSSRYLLLTGKDIEVVDDGRVFSVRLPLLDKPE